MAKRTNRGVMGAGGGVGGVAGSKTFVRALLALFLRVLGSVVAGSAAGSALLAVVFWIFLPTSSASFKDSVTTAAQLGAVLGYLAGGSAALTWELPGCLASVVIVSCVLFGFLGVGLLGDYLFPPPPAAFEFESSARAYALMWQGALGGLLVGLFVVGIGWWRERH